MTWQDDAKLQQALEKNRWRRGNVMVCKKCGERHVEAVFLNVTPRICSECGGPTVQIARWYRRKRHRKGSKDWKIEVLGDVNGLPPFLKPKEVPK